MFLNGLVAIIAPFATAIAIVLIINFGPRSRAKAEIMKARAMAELEQQRLRITGANDERTALTLVEQEKRINSLEEEVNFLRKLVDQR